MYLSPFLALVLMLVAPFYSRNILISPHCNPLNPSCMDVLTTAYHTLLCSILDTWSPKHTLSPAAFVQFVWSVLSDLPSTSSSSSTASSNVAIFGEYLVDMIWSVDAELDEILADATTVLNGNDDGIVSSSSIAPLVKTKKAKQNVEHDKETIRVVVKKLLVRSAVFASQLPTHNMFFRTVA
jgi:THO complex subunit 2